MADKSRNDKNKGKNKNQSRGERGRGSQGGRSSQKKSEDRDSWILDDESMDSLDNQ